jgi:hypothetical protein
VDLVKILKQEVMTIQTFFSEGYSFVSGVYSVFANRLCFVCLINGPEETRNWKGRLF